MIEHVEGEIGGRCLTIETGHVARQADGAVVVRYGDSMVLVTAVASKVQKQGIDFLPLTVDYQEKAYAAGKIPGGYFKREGRPSEKEILSSRLIDRPHRPLFPEGWYYETQVIASVLSADQTASTELLGMIGASAALGISDIPLSEVVGAVRVGRLDGKFVINPGYADLEKSDLNMVVAATKDALMMVEGEAKVLTEDEMLEALDLAHREIRKVVALTTGLMARIGKPKRSVSPLQNDPALTEEIRSGWLAQIREAILISNKTARQEKMDAILEEILSRLNPAVSSGPAEPKPDRSVEIKRIFHDLERDTMRRMILERGIRADGRGVKDIRPITCEIGVLPRTHGSALFTRGETQSLAVVTLGTVEDEQRIDALEGEFTKKFLLHYNFPPYSVGEARPLRGPGRREIGHGALAERAVRAVIPSWDEFPYTLRIVSDILESNGSSSMATVCGSTLALMDAGVKIKTPVAGIAMGLIKEGNSVVVLSDILGLEDHLGDMDFKVTGTRDGITALQMDIKIGGITAETMRQALRQAREGRLTILDCMAACIAAPRSSLSAYAPRVMMLKIKKERIGDVIGPGGKTIRGILEKTGAKIDIEDDGRVTIAADNEASAQAAAEMVQKLTEEVEVGRIYMGRVVKIVEFGAFVEILPNVEGLLHISQIAPERIKQVKDVLKEGDEVPVKVLEVDERGKIRLSRKEALQAHK